MKKAPSLWLTIPICIAICLTVGFLSGLSTMHEVKTWYLTIEKPVFNPPNEVFAPAWTALYILMGIALGLILNKGWNHPEKKAAVWIFVLQLLLNGAWSVIFFSFHAIAIALIDIIALWVLILLTIIRFRRIYPAAGYLLIPYILWVSFATVLNASILFLNS